MSDVIDVGSDTWTIYHSFSFRTVLDKKLRFASSPTVFDVRGRWCHNNIGFLVGLKVSTESPISFVIEYNMYNPDVGRSHAGKLTDTMTESGPPFYCVDKLSRVISLELKLTYVGNASEQFCPLRGDVMSGIERGPAVTLIGFDGNVSVPRRILKLRSVALDAMFTHDSKEKKTGQIELKDVDCKTLAAFVHFLMTGEITDGKETALGLILLGDKYDIPAMKSTAECFVKENIRHLNKDDVIEVFSKVSSDLLYGAMVTAWSKK